MKCERYDGTGKIGYEGIVVFNDIDHGKPNGVRMEEKIDQFLVHEALDRCHVINCLLDDHLIQHPFVQQDEEVLRLLCAAGDAIGVAYQMIGNYHQK